MSKVRKEIDKYGTIRYYNEQDQLQREDGPAVEYPNGSKSWFINGRYHREDGPAVEWSDGSKAWYINNERLTEEEFNAYKKRLTMKKVLGIS